jgi:integrase
MPRPVAETRLDTRAVRTKLKPQPKPYWRSIETGLHIGYRKSAGAGAWVVRWGTNASDYKTQTIGRSDDEYDADGVRVLSYQQAVDLARKTVAIARRPAEAEPEPKAPFTVRDAVTEYLRWADTHTKSARDTRLRADALILPTLGDKLCADLTPRLLAEWRDGIAATGRRLRTKVGVEQRTAAAPDTPDAIRRRRSTANRTLTILKAALNHAWRHGDIASDEAWRRVQPFEGVDHARIRYLSIAEATRLVNACDSDLRLLVQAALVTGARRGELAAMLAQDFNPDNSTVHIRESKSGKPRHVVLTDEGVRLFAAMTAGKAPADPIFTRADGHRWDKAYHTRPMQEAAARAKLGPEVTFHILRHTWASLAVMNGVPLMVVADNLGHADTRMVEKHYGHLAESYKAKLIREKAPTFGIVADPTVTPLRKPGT